MKKFLDRFVLFLLKIFFISSVGILVIRVINTISIRTINFYLVPWGWLNHLFADTDPVGSIIILFALLSGIIYLVWIWWDPFFVRLPHQKGSSWLYYNWEEGLESSTNEKNLKKI